MCTRNRGDHQLSDAHAAGDGHRFSAKVYEQHLDLAAVVSVDGAWGIKYGQSVTRGETRTRPHLGFMTFWKRDGDTGGNECTSAGCKHEWGVGRYCSEQIKTRSMGALVGRQRQVLAVRQALDPDLGQGLVRDSL